MKSLLTIVLLTISLSGFSQVAARHLSPKIGVYTYQNVGLKGGFGLKTYPFTQYRQLGFNAGYFYYAGDARSRMNGVIDQYKGFEVGVSSLRESYHNRSGGAKKAFRGIGINAFYTREGFTDNENWYQLKNCGNSVNPSSRRVPNSSSAYGFELYYRIARGYENDKVLALFSIQPGVRLINSKSEYSVHCNPALIDLVNPNEKVSTAAFPLGLRLEMEIYFKY